MVDRLKKSTISSDRLLDILRFQTEIVQQGLDLYDVMQRVAECSQSLTRAQAAAVELVEGDEMVYRAATGIAEAQLGLRLERESSLSGYCIGVGGPVYCKDSETDDRVDRGACRRVGLRSMIVVPLKHQSVAIGVLKVMSSEIDIFTSADVKVLELMSDLIAAAMSNASKHQSGELYYSATYDSLTELYNRALFYDHLRQRIAQSSRCCAQFGVLVLDMDNLKNINDTYGHKAGDAAIREFAVRIKSVTRETDTVARIGGDEFAILLHKLTSTEEIRAAISRIINVIEMQFMFNDQTLPLAASIGSAVYPDDGADINILIEKADQLMYEMKRYRKQKNYN